jgi:hypothetical protein
MIGSREIGGLYLTCKIDILNISGLREAYSKIDPDSIQYIHYKHD